ncbi:hypothetical protein P0082_02200 [Candidatus Haliotispira prima]|uniref:Uracil-DNA glycosylase-like domain-containing protein n=1 Tax=Candidatus Haliotispira prima TaxID=3034016 RepID=A0ABY8MI36_9SPIO|nr:hypothetical protein P0082_02200 [Candidatus Haliotispira prima]
MKIAYDIFFDTEFDSLPNLAWLPWVGCKYRDLPYKLLIVGQSNSDNKKRINDTQQNKGFTRWVIERVIEGDNGWPVFQNIHKILKGGKNVTGRENIQGLWENLCFYDFVQRVMLKTPDGLKQPTSDDYLAGKPVFDELIKMLKPDVCLFIGVRTAKVFGSLVERKPEKIDGTYPFTGVIKTGTIPSVEKDIQLYFMRNPGSVFKWGNWHKDIGESMPELLLQFADEKAESI